MMSPYLSPFERKSLRLIKWHLFGTNNLTTYSHTTLSSVQGPTIVAFQISLVSLMIGIEPAIFISNNKCVSWVKRTFYQYAGADRLCTQAHFIFASLCCWVKLALEIVFLVFKPYSSISDCGLCSLFGILETVVFMHFGDRLVSLCRRQICYFWELSFFKAVFNLL